MMIRESTTITHQRRSSATILDMNTTDRRGGREANAPLLISSHEVPRAAPQRREEDDDCFLRRHEACYRSERRRRPPRGARGKRWRQRQLPKSPCAQITQMGHVPKGPEPARPFSPSRRHLEREREDWRGMLEAGPQRDGQRRTRRRVDPIIITRIAAHFAIYRLDKWPTFGKKKKVNGDLFPIREDLIRHVILVTDK